MRKEQELTNLRSIGMNAIIVMAREPKPNVVKTRLTPPLDPVDAARIYQCFLLDKIEQIASIRNGDRFVAYTPEQSRDFFERIIPKNISLINQSGKNLGERLANVSKTLFENGYRRIVMINSDSPNLPSSFITSGLEALERFDLALGPCEDGGYYLIGLSSETPQIFQDIPWSTSKVTEITKEKANALSKSLFLLEEWYDIDTIKDLKRLKTELDLGSDVTRGGYSCENTYKILSELF